MSGKNCFLECFSLGFLVRKLSAAFSKLFEINAEFHEFQLVSILNKISLH